MKKKILVIGTGGTIASKQSDSGLVPVVSAEELLAHVPAVKDFAQVDSVQIFSVDSTDITPSHWLTISSTIKDNYDDYDGFVITHGTDTLAYTAAALSYLILNSPKPIVITGSQKPIDADDTDARRNLRDSILYATNPGSTNVSIVFDGKVIAGTRAKKEKSKSYDAFSSINYPYLAIVRDGRVIRYIQDETPASLAPVFADKICDRVFTLKMTPGFDKSMLPQIFEKYDCIIVESFGVGGIPSYLIEEFRGQMESHNTLVIVATQVANEGSDMMVYQVGHDVKEDFDLLETYDMTLESAFAKACWLLGRSDLAGGASATGGTESAGGLNRDAIKAEFYGPINHDITMLP